MSAPSGYYIFQVNSLDASKISFYITSQSGSQYFTVTLFTQKGAQLISWPHLLAGNETLDFVGLVQPGQSYVLALQGNADPASYVFTTNISIPANAPAGTPFTPGITGGKVTNLNVQSSVTWKTDGTGLATVTFSPVGANGIAQVFLNGNDITAALSEQGTVDLTNLAGSSPVTVQIPVPYANSTIQIKTAGGASWSGNFNSPGPSTVPVTQTVTGSVITSDQTLLGITLPGYAWGAGAVALIWGISKVFKKK